jgi:hypothetical protein
MPVNPYGRDYSYVQVADDIARRIDIGEITRKLPGAGAGGYGWPHPIRHARRF